VNDCGQADKLAALGSHSQGEEIEKVYGWSQSFATIHIDHVGFMRILTG